MKKTLLAGSWLGEFGWEIMSWQGYVRKLSRGYDQTIVSAPPSHEALYEDFCDTYLGHTIPGDRDCWKLHGDHRLKEALDIELAEMASRLKADRLVPSGHVPLDQQEFVVYGDPSRVPPERRMDVLFHFRLRHDRGQERNTPADLAADILRYMPKEWKLGCIGSREEATCFPGYADLRGIPLRELMDVIHAAWLVTGPASGPLVLASLCKTPHVSWSTRRWYSAVKMDNKERMTRGWNPFNVPCKVLDQFGFQPPAIEAAKAITEAKEWAAPWKQEQLKKPAASG